MALESSFLIGRPSIRIPPSFVIYFTGVFSFIIILHLY